MKTVRSRQVLLAVLGVALVLLAWAVVRGATGPSGSVGADRPASTVGTVGTLGTAVSAGTDPVSGLSWVAASSLPPEARQTLALVRAGGPFPYPRSDNRTFDNRERVLPQEPRGYYREFTVVTPGSDDRGARRIITGTGGERYWTADHYATFSRIREGT